MPKQRTFSTDEALEAVLRVFWSKGYEGTSYTDLVAATGVERPALYSAFGNKEAMFLHALDRYASNYGNYVWEALRQPTSRQVATRVLEGAAELTSRYASNTGCLGINGALAASDDAEPARRALIEWRAAGEEALRQRFEQAKQEGDLPKDADPATLAAFILAVSHGIAVQAKAGFCQDKLLQVAKQAVNTWPGA